MASAVLPDAAASTSLDGITKRGASTVYLALLTGSVDASATVATLPEVGTAGYARQPLAWTVPARPTPDQPVTTLNSALITFGPFTAAMLQDAQWAALVTSASGTSGTVQYAWPLPQSLTADVNESIQIPINKIAIAQN